MITVIVDDFDSEEGTWCIVAVDRTRYSARTLRGLPQDR